MFRNEKLELKVGLFIGIGVFLMFFIVFSISDFYLLKKGYEVRVIFDYVNGLTDNSPTRLAGVHVGEVKNLKIFYDEKAGRTRVSLNVWVDGDAKIETDAVARINTLGLLGEQYLEITPGKAKDFVKSGDMIASRNPANVGMQMEKMGELVGSVSKVFRDMERGDGTLGKLLTDDTLYDDLETIFGRLKRGEGTIGKLLVDETVYDNVEAFTGDIKAHPWKLLHKTPDKKQRPDDDKRTDGSTIKPRS